MAGFGGVADPLINANINITNEKLPIIARMIATVNEVKYGDDKRTS